MYKKQDCPLKIKIGLFLLTSTNIAATEIKGHLHWLINKVIKVQIPISYEG